MSRSVKKIQIVVAASLYICSSWADEYPRERLARILDTQPYIENVRSGAQITSKFISHKDDDVTSPTFGTELCIVEIPKGAGKIKVKNLNTEGDPKNVYKSKVSNRAIAVITGGFFGLDETGATTPLGLVKSNGNQLSKNQLWKTGGFIAARASSATIFPVSDLKKLSSYPEVVQSKPILVWQSKDGIISSTGDRFDRSAIAKDKAGNIFFFVIYEPAGAAASLAEFSYLLLNYKPTTGGKVSSAIAMDGGPGAHLYVPSLDRHCGSGIPNYIPNVIYAK